MWPRSFFFNQHDAQLAAQILLPTFGQMAFGSLSRCIDGQKTRHLTLA